MHALRSRAQTGQYAMREVRGGPARRTGGEPGKEARVIKTGDRFTARDFPDTIYTCREIETLTGIVVATTGARFAAWSVNPVHVRFAQPKRIKLSELRAWHRAHIRWVVAKHGVEIRASAESGCRLFHGYGASEAKAIIALRRDMRWGTVARQPHDDDRDYD